MTQNITTISHLPPEIFWLILDNIEAADLLRCAQVNWQFNRQTNDPTLLTPLFKKYLPFLALPERPALKSRLFQAIAQGAHHLGRGLYTHSVLFLGKKHCIAQQTWTTSFALAPKNKLISGSQDGRIRIFDVEQKKWLRSFVLCKGITSLAQAAHDLLLMGTYEGALKIYDLKSRKIDSISAHHLHLTYVLATRKGTVVTGSWDRTIKEWDLSRQACIKEVNIGHWVSCLAESPTGKVLVGLTNGRVKTVDLENNDNQEPRPIFDTQVNAILPLEGDTFLCASNNGMLAFINPKAEQAISLIPAHNSCVVNSLYRTQAGLILSASADQTIKVWDPKSWRCLTTLYGHERNIIFLKEEADGLLLSGGDDHSVVRWNFTSSKKEVLAELAVAFKMGSPHAQERFERVDCSEKEKITRLARNKRKFDLISPECNSLKEENDYQSSAIAEILRRPSI